MSIWQTLGITQTNDEKEIRRAYARQVKKYRPDSHPEEYQQLREAFEEAKRYAAYAIYDDESADDEYVEEQANIDVDVPHLESLLHQEAVNEEAVDDDQQQQELSEIRITYPFSDVLLDDYQPSINELPVVETAYTQELIDWLAKLFIIDENAAKRELVELWENVSQKGSLQTHQQFHQDFAWALSEQEGLTEAVVEHVSSLLGWRLDEYNSEQIIPFYIQNALTEQLRQTEVARAWKQCQIDAVHGDYIVSQSLRVLTSKNEKVSYKVRLIPGLIPQIAEQVKQRTSEYPELKDKFNPAILSFIQQPRIAFNWRGVFLCIFWGLLLNMVATQPDVNSGVAIVAGVIILFYLFFNDLIMFGLHSRKKAFTVFLVSEFFITLFVILIFFLGLSGVLLFFITGLDIGPAHGAQAMVIFILMWLFWYAWPKDKPSIRRPGIMMYRVFASPWKFLEYFKFSWFSLVWLVIIYLIYYSAMHNLLKYCTEFLVN